MAMTPLTGMPSSLGAQSVLDGAAGLTVERAGVEQSLRLLRRTAGVSLVYSPDLLPRERVVSCPCQGATVRQALERILDGTGLTFRVTGAQIRIVPVGLTGPSALTGVVSGRIVGEEGEALSGARVELEDGPAAFAARGGAFTLRDVRPGTYALSVTSLGWMPRRVEDVEVAAGDTVVLTIVLERHVIPLPEILVAPGTFSLLEDVSPGAVQVLTREEIQTMPQVGEDVFRSMKRLPGVAAHDISTRLHIRGGSDREVLVRLDGIELYEPYHMKDWDGALGIVDLNALGGVELTAGGFGAEHGDKMTGVFDMTSRTAVGDARTTLGMSITNVTAMSRGGFADDKGSWLVSGRRGFMGILIRLIGEDERISPQYYDVFGKVSYQPNRANLVTAHVLHAGDDLGLHGLDGVDRVDVNTDWQSSYGWLTWRSDLSERVSATTIAWTGRLTRDRAGSVEDPGRPGAPHRISVFDDRGFTFAGVSHDLEVEIHDRAILKLGGEARRLRADYAYSSRTWTDVLGEDEVPFERVDSSEVDLEPEGSQLAAYAAVRARPVDPLTLEVGLRWDRVTHTGDDDVAPRLMAAVELDEATTLRASWGRYHQSHGMHELRVGDGETEFSPSERSEQIAVGLERRFGRGVVGRLELYDRRASDQMARFLNLEQELELFPEAEGDRVLVDPARGRARGIEVLVERKGGRTWNWSASYVLSVAEDEVPDLFGAACESALPCADELWVPRRFDQRHALGLLASYSPDPRWTISAGWRYHSGWPATPWSYTAEELESGIVFWTRTFGPLRSLRLPAYHRLDLRVTHDFELRGNPLHAYLDFFNLYDRTNLAGYEFGGTYIDGRVMMERRRGQTLLPMLPTIGFRYEF
jgi:hypothetical protein